MSSRNPSNGQFANLDNDANNNSSASPVPSPPAHAKSTRWQNAQSESTEQAERVLPRFVFDPDSGLVCYWTAAVALATLYNTWMIALRIAFPEIRPENAPSCLPYVDVLCDLIYLLDIFIQLRTAYLQDGIPVFDPSKIRHQYVSQIYFIQDVISVLPSQTVLSYLPDAFGCCKYFLCTVGAARLTKLLKFHILYKFYDLAESFTSNPHLIRVLRLFLNLAIIIHWIACSYYLLSEYEGLGSNEWVYTNATDQQRFSRKYIICMYWSAMTLTTIGNTNPPETDVEYIFTGIIFFTGVFVFATVMGNVGDVISSMNANRQEFQARMDYIQMYLTHKKVPASLQLKIKKWAEYTWSRTKATDESRLLNMLPERLRAEVAVHVHLDSLKKVKIFEQCETGFLCELVLKLRSQVFSPGDYVCRAGETGREMFIINHGKVEVIVINPATNKPMVVAVLSEGNYFGEISLLRLDGVQNSSFFNRRTADVRSIGYSELLCLSRRDLMSALVEYPEAKSILEDQAKQRMKTNLRAQRAFSVDALTRDSQEQSSVDSGIAKDEGQDVSEIKAMIEDLKNATKVPGRTVWQLIARCEVLQAKLCEKEQEVMDSKERIRELEQLLFSHHYPNYVCASPYDSETQGRQANRVIKQYSQDEGRQLLHESSEAVDDDETSNRRVIPDVRISRTSSDASSSNDEECQPDHKMHNLRDNNFIKTSKITNIYEKIGGNSSTKNGERNFRATFELPSSTENLEAQDIRQPVRYEEFRGPSAKNFKLFSQSMWNIDPSVDYSFSNEMMIDHQIIFNDNDGISLSATFKDVFSLTDSSNCNVPTIPEESEDEASNASEASTSSSLYHNHTGDAVKPDNLETVAEEDVEFKPNMPRTISLDNLPSTIESRPPVVVRPKGIMRLHSAPANIFPADIGSPSTIEFLRMASLSSRQSECSNSRRSSLNWDSEDDSEGNETSS